MKVHISLSLTEWNLLADEGLEEQAQSDLRIYEKALLRTLQNIITVETDLAISGAMMWPWSHEATPVAWVSPI